MDSTHTDVQEQLQRFYGAKGQVSDLPLLGSGFETDVYAFSLAAPGSHAEEMVLRVYGGQGAAEKAEREFAAMRGLREAGYPVPRMGTLCRDSEPLGSPFITMERIHGVSL